MMGDGYGGQGDGMMPGWQGGHPGGYDHGGYEGGPPQGMFFPPPQGQFPPPQGYWNNGRCVDGYGYDMGMQGYRGGLNYYGIPPEMSIQRNEKGVDSGGYQSNNQPPMVQAKEMPVVTITRVESPKPVLAPAPALESVVISVPQVGPVTAGAANSVGVEESKTVNREESSDEETLSKEEVNKIRQKYAVFSTSNLMRMPTLTSQRLTVEETVALSSTLANNVEEIRIGAGDFGKTSEWVRGWDIPLEKHVLNAVSHRMPSTQGLDLKTKITSAFTLTRQQLQTGMTGPEALDFLVRALTKTLSMATPQQVVFALQNFVVEVGTPFSDYMMHLRALVQNALSVGHVSQQDNVLQLAVRESVCDQYSSISMDVFKGRDLKAVPYDSIGDLMEALEALAWNTTEATQERRETMRGTKGQVRRTGQGGGNASVGGKSYVNTAENLARMYSRKQPAQGGAVMSIQEELEDEEREFGKVHYVASQWGENKGDLSYIPFYKRFNSRQAQDEARRAYGLKCLNCGDQSHFVRDCPKQFMNKSEMMNPALGEGTPQEIKERWSKWLKRLRDWHDARRRNG